MRRGITLIELLITVAIVAIIIVIGFKYFIGSNWMAKSFGGSMQMDLPANTKLVTATWKEDELWYLIRPARDGEKPEVLKFQEKSNLGVLEGEVTFVEH